MSELRQAEVAITPEFLLELMHFPPGTSICGARYDPFNRTVYFVMEHADLKPITPGHPLPPAAPRFSRHEPVTFDGWGQ